MSDFSSRSSGFEDPGRMVGGTEHGCLGLEDDTHRDPLKQGAKSALVEKGLDGEPEVVGQGGRVQRRPAHVA